MTQKIISTLIKKILQVKLYKIVNNHRLIRNNQKNKSQRKKQRASEIYEQKEKGTNSAIVGMAF